MNFSTLFKKEPPKVLSLSPEEETSENEIVKNFPDNKLIRIFIIEDDMMFGKAVKFALGKKSNYDVTVFQTGQEFLDNLHKNPDIVTIDYNLPDMKGIEVLEKVRNYNRDILSIILSGQDQVEVVVQTYKAGAKDYIVKKENCIVDLTNSIYNLSSNVSLRKEVEELKSKIIDRVRYEQMIGESPAILNVIRMMQKVEKSNMMVMVTGESGTGKEMIGKLIHYNSPRGREPYIAVNMAAISDDLIESELFGHEKGAFTGADSRRLGKFEEANRGTIFLDEIGEMDLAMQSKLLRVLQENTITRVGGNKETKLDVRVVAATNKNLMQMVKDGKFREDLYYRLSGFPVQLPPLRDRGNDIIILAKYFLKNFCENNKMEQKGFTREAIEIFIKHNWPGNVRELKATVERAAIIADRNLILVDDLVFSSPAMAA
jgi:two-component system response regulator AtoC